MFKKLDYKTPNNLFNCKINRSNIKNKYSNKCKHFNNPLNNKNKSLIGYYQNVRGLHTKLSSLRYNIPLFNNDYFVLVETRLNAEILDAESGFDYIIIIMCFVWIEMIKRVGSLEEVE